jgi:hypothetical protein
MQFIFIEGLPGSGKTSFSRRLKKDLEATGMDVISYQEGDFHPIDLAWIAIFNQSTLNQTLDQYPSLKKQIKEHLVCENDLFFLPYLKVKIDKENKDFYQYCEKHEIYNESNIDKFLNIHLDRIKYFLKHAKNKVYIFECVSLQNHVNELLIGQAYSYPNILVYFKDFFKPFMSFQTKIYYIKQENIEKTLKRVSDERLSDDLEIRKNWIDYVIDFVEKDKLKRYIGYKGVIEYAKDRQATELKLLKDLQIDSKVVNLSDNYDAVYEKILADATDFCD